MDDLEVLDNMIDLQNRLCIGIETFYSRDPDHSDPEYYSECLSEVMNAIDKAEALGRVIDILRTLLYT